MRVVDEAQDELIVEMDVLGAEGREELFVQIAARNPAMEEISERRPVPREGSAISAQGSQNSSGHRRVDFAAIDRTIARDDV